MTTKTDEQERAEFEAWMRDNHPGHCLIFVNGYLHKWPQRLWEAYQAGRAALQSQDREDAVNAAINKLANMTPRPPKAITYDQGWKIIDVVQRELCPAIDHARRIEGERNDP